MSRKVCVLLASLALLACSSTSTVVNPTSVPRSIEPSPAPKQVATPVPVQATKPSSNVTVPEGVLNPIAFTLITIKTDTKLQYAPRAIERGGNVGPTPLPKGTKVSLLNVSSVTGNDSSKSLWDGKWYRVYWNNRFGWVKSEDTDYAVGAGIQPRRMIPPSCASFLQELKPGQTYVANQLKVGLLVDAYRPDLGKNTPAVSVSLSKNGRATAKSSASSFTSQGTASSLIVDYIPLTLEVTKGDKVSWQVTGADTVVKTFAVLVDLPSGCQLEERR